MISKLDQNSLNSLCLGAWPLNANSLSSKAAANDILEQRSASIDPQWLDDWKVPKLY